LRAVCLALLLIGCNDEPQIKAVKSARFYLERDYSSGDLHVYILSEPATGCEWVMVIGYQSAMTMDRIPQWGKKTCGAKP
jgi:hypothetical protein